MNVSYALRKWEARNESRSDSGYTLKFFSHSGISVRDISKEYLSEHLFILVPFKLLSFGLVLSPPGSGLSASISKNYRLQKAKAVIGVGIEHIPVKHC